MVSSISLCPGEGCPHGVVRIVAPPTRDLDLGAGSVHWARGYVQSQIDRDLPVLAICRGLQMLNVVLGGTLVQHIEGHRYRERPDAHPIAIASHSRLRSILEVDEFVVNSRHHQCADRVASGLVVVARAPDNVVEALELPAKRFVLAVQWHPEDRAGGPDARLFEAFRDAMRLTGEK